MAEQSAADEMRAEKEKIIKTRIYDYSFPGRDRAFVSDRQIADTDGEPSFLIMRDSMDSIKLDLIYSEPSFTDEWTEEDINGFDYVVIAKSDYETKQYEAYANGSKTGKTVEVRSESVTLSYYDLNKKELMDEEVIERKPFPETKSSSKDYTITKDEIVDRVKEHLNIDQEK